MGTGNTKRKEQYNNLKKEPEESQKKKNEGIRRRIKKI